MNPARFSPPCVDLRLRVLPLLMVLLGLGPQIAAAAGGDTRAFSLPAGSAAQTLKQFAEQSGRGVVFVTEVVRDVRTNAVQGELAPAAALRQLLAGTALLAEEDVKTGAFAVRKGAADPNAQQATPPGIGARPNQDRGSAPRRAPSNTTGEAGDNSVLVLSPFEVGTSADVGYEALNANSITGLNVALVNVPVTAEIYNRQFYDDVGISSIGDALLEWASGQSPNGKPTTGLLLPGDLVGNTPFVIRGIPVGDSPRVDGFLTGALTFLDNSTQERTEIIRGPQALLYGAAAGGGLINIISKQANLSRDTARLQLRTDRHGTLRAEFDANRVLRPNLALRAVLTHGKEWYYSYNAAKSVDAWFLAAVYRPLQRVTVRVNGGITRVDKINGNDATFTLPGDPRNGVDLNLLLARGQTNDLFLGRVNWSNADALGGVGILGYELPSLGVTTDLQLTPRINLRVMGGYNHFNNDKGLRTTTSAQGLLAPDSPRNPTGKWATGAVPDVSHFSLDNRGIRALLNGKFDLLGGRIKSDVTAGAESKRQRTGGTTDNYYLVDANGQFVVNAAARGDNNAGRTRIPIVYWSIEDGTGGPFRRGMREHVVDGKTYRLSQQQQAGSVPPTPTNPRGFNGASPPNDDKSSVKGYFASMYSEWFNNRFSTLGGVRRDYADLLRSDASAYSVWTTTWSAGAVLHLNDYLSPYYNRSLSFAPNFGVGGARTQDNEPPGVNNGVGSEFGLKFSVPKWGASGSLALYKTDVKNNQVVLRDGVDIVDPTSALNGYHRTSSLAYKADYTVKGLELSMAAQPTRNWRTRLSFSYNTDEVGRKVAMRRWYNDEFSVNAAGQVLFNNGTIATVPANAADPNSARIPLTTAMMKDPRSGYAATLDAGSGRIMNLGGRTFASLGLVGGANGLTIGTGRTGLPISAHQLNWVPPTADYVITDGSEHLAIPRSTLSASAVRSFHEGWLNGFSSGITLTVRQHQLAYYYIDAAAGGARRPRILPDQVGTNLMLSYSTRLFSKYQWVTQLNVTNLLNHRDLVYILNTGTGVPTSAKMNAVPRAWAWSNTISF